MRRGPKRGPEADARGQSSRVIVLSFFASKQKLGVKLSGNSEMLDFLALSQFKD